MVRWGIDRLEEFEDGCVLLVMGMYVMAFVGAWCSTIRDMGSRCRWVFRLLSCGC